VTRLAIESRETGNATNSRFALGTAATDKFEEAALLSVCCFVLIKKLEIAFLEPATPIVPRNFLQLPCA
jgi:hypothetical protein